MADELPPPWVALPGLSPDDPATQGMAEAYIDLNWLPFWRTLSDEAKEAYLDRWEASPAWRAQIARAYDWDPEEAEQDARESEAYLAEWRAAQPDRGRRPPWWRFWR